MDLGRVGADGSQPSLQAQPIERRQRQIDEYADAVVQHAHGFRKRHALRDIGTFDGGGIRQAPMCRHRLTGPDGAGFVRRVVADGENEVQVRRPSPRKLVPTLRAQRIDSVVLSTQQLEREGMHRSARKAAGAVRAETAVAEPIQHRFGEYAARRIASAQKEHVVGLVRHALHANHQAHFPEITNRINEHVYGACHATDKNPS